MSRKSSRRATRGMRISGWLSTVVVGVLVLASLYGYVRYRGVWDSITRLDVSSDLGKRPPKYTDAINVLLIGSDTRIGGNERIGGTGGCNCSDTLMVLHISPGHHRVTVMSIPRDTVVPVLGCAATPATAGSPATSGQQADPTQVERINAALANGGPGCTWKTVEHETGIRVDHFVELDFVGGQKIIDDIGGVNVCLPYAVDDPISGLHISAGRHHIYGRTAVAFWRTREGLGLGSDLQRIQRDQFLMAGLVKGVEHSGLLNSPGKLLKVITDAASAMETDTGLDQNTMLQIAESMRGLSTRSVQFVTAPNEPYPANTNEVQFAQPAADQMFSSIAHDTKLPKSPMAKAAKGRAAKGTAGKSKTPPVLDAAPATVSVQVLNGSGVGGAAKQAAGELSSRGFKVVGQGNADNFSYTRPVIEYAASTDLPAVKTLKAQLTSPETVLNSSLAPGTVELIVGSDFTGLTPGGKSSVGSLTKHYGGIKASTNICHNSQAFAS